jgi:hypothetical protein
LRRRAPQHRGAAAGTLGPGAAGRSFLPESVLEGVWVLLELVPTSGRLWSRRNRVAAMAEQLQLRTADSCADGLQRVGEKEGKELHWAARQAVGPGLGAGRARRRQG